MSEPGARMSTQGPKLEKEPEIVIKNCELEIFAAVFRLPFPESQQRDILAVFDIVRDRIGFHRLVVS